MPNNLSQLDLNEPTVKGDHGVMHFQLKWRGLLAPDKRTRNLSRIEVKIIELLYTTLRSELFSLLFFNNLGRYLGISSRTETFF